MRVVSIGLIAFWSLLAAESAPAQTTQPAGPKEAAGQSATPVAMVEGGTIEIKEIGHTRVVYLECRGPYWSLGKPFRQVAEFMALHDQPGPMFARYLDDPDKIEVGNLRAEVGFVVTGDVDAPPPYQTRVLPQRTVACLTVEGYSGRAPGYYKLLLDWIEKRGYQADRGLTEVYAAAGAGGGSGGRRTEIQATLVGGVRPVEEPAGQAADEQVATAPPSFAERLIPVGGDMPAPVRDRLAQVLLRLQAIQTVVGMTYPSQRAEVDAFVDPILARWRSGFGGLSGDEVTSADEAGVLDELDALLVEITLNRVVPQVALRRMTELTAPLPDWVAARVEADASD